MLLLARSHLTDTERSRMGTLFDAGVDWTQLVTLAEQHAVTPLVCHRLVQDRFDAVPKALIEAARSRLGRTRELNKTKAGELIDLIDDLAGENIQAVPYKGPVLAVQAYGDLGLRSFQDLDFLVRTTDVPKVRDILGARGYEAGHQLSPAREAVFVRYAGEDIFFHAGGKSPVEPHWEFAPGTLSIRLDYPSLLARLTEVDLLDKRLPCWSGEDTALILCIHGSKSLWARLSMVCDLAELIRGTPAFDWETLLTRAEAQGCLRIVRVALLLAHNLVDLPVPDPVKKQLLADRHAVDLATQMQNRLWKPASEETSIYHLHLFHFKVREKVSDQLRYVFRTITTPRVQHFALADLPDSVFFLYYPVKLVHDYVLLPLWLIAKRFGLVRAKQG